MKSRRQWCMLMIKNGLRFWSDTRGFLALEAAIVLPGIMAVVILMISFIQISAAEIALQSAVSETAKSVASYWQPVRMLYGEAKSKAASSAPGQWVQQALERVNGIRDKIGEAEDFVGQYEAYLPGPVTSLLEWEMMKRQQLEEAAVQEGRDAADSVIDPLLCSAFQPVLLHYAPSKSLSPERVMIESVRLPSLEPGGNADFELTASYRVRLPVPFFHKTVTIRKKALERAWVGDE